jgi:hypothetical protein
VFNFGELKVNSYICIYNKKTTMKLVKVTIRQTEDEIMGKLESGTAESLIFADILSNIVVVEFLNEEGFTSFLCELNDYTLLRLVDSIVNLSFDFSVEDITNKVLLSENISVNYFDNGIDVSSDLNNLINSFYESNIDVDIILDKISSKGIESLSEKDKIVLSNY